jgi:Sortase domain
MSRPRPRSRALLRAVVALGAAAFVLGCDSAGPTRQPRASAIAVPSSSPETVGATAPGMGAAGLPTLTPDAILHRVPTRVTVPDLHIDLPVVEPPNEPDHFPFCRVAEFLPSMSRPGWPGTTYVYAHARKGMFLPILEASWVAGGRSMVGLRVEVYTSDNRRFTYEVVDVQRHVVSLESAYRNTAEQLILQTSEGPVGTAGKTILIGVPRSDEPAPSAEANPVAKPVRCA